MTEPFKTSETDAAPLTQPNPAGEALYFRSNASADTGTNVTVSGLVSAVQTSETNPLHAADGRVEVGTADEFQTVLQFKIASAVTGDVTLYGSGAPAQGRIEVAAVPADGDDLTLSLAGLGAPEYTLKRHGPNVALFWMRTKADVAGGLAGRYFDVPDAAGLVRVWFFVSGAGAAPAVPSGGRLKQVVFANNSTAATIATAIETAFSGDGALTVSTHTPGSNYVGFFQSSGTPSILPASEGTSTMSLKTRSPAEVGTFDPSSAYDVAMGATADETALILAAVINGTAAVRAAFTVTCTADSAGSLNQKYFIVGGRWGTWAIWLSNSATATPPAGALAADFEIMVQFTNGDSANAIAGAVSRFDGLGTFNVNAVGNVVTFETQYRGTLPAGRDAGNAGFAIADTVTGSYGKDVSADDLSWCGDGTNANPFVTAEADGDTVTLTDKIACRRLLGWDISQATGSTLTVVPMIGGVDGAILATIAAGLTAVHDLVVLDTLDLATATLPAGLAPTFQGIYVGSTGAELHFRIENVVTPITSHYEWSDDGINWAAGATSITSLDNIPAATPYRVTIAERAEFVRWVIDSNTNAASTKLDARVNWG